MGSIYVRTAEDADHEQVRNLSARCPQEGMITFFVDRTPRFNTLHRILDPEAWHLVACREEKVIGLVGVVQFRANVLGTTRKVGYLLDLRLDKAYRGGTTAYRLIKAAVDRIFQSDIDMIVANFIKDNKRSLIFTSGRGGLPAGFHLGDNRVFNLLPLFYMKPDHRFEIAKPSENEIPEILEIYNKYAGDYKIAPEMTENVFRNYLNSIEGLSADHFLIARENGKIKAVTALWDEHTYKAYQVLRLNPGIRMVNGLLKFLSHFRRVPQPLRLNEPLRQLSLVLFAHDNCPEALETLFRHVNNISLGSHYTLTMVYAQEHDPVFRILKKFRGVSVQSEMYLFAKDQEVYNKLRENYAPVLFDLSMLT